MSILFKNAKIIETRDGRLNVLENAFLGVEGDTLALRGHIKLTMKRRICMTNSSCRDLTTVMAILQ